MAGNIKGVTIEFRGDTTKLDKALRQISKETNRIDRELRQVDKDLKFKPTSVELWRQKQQLLTRELIRTEEKLDLLKETQKKFDAGEIQMSREEYNKLQREIIETDSKLKYLEKELRKVGNVKLKALSEQFKKIGNEITKVGQNMTKYVTTPLTAGFAASAKASLSYGDSLAKVATIADDSQVSIEKLSQDIISLSNASGKGANELAEATYQALSASVQTKDVSKFVQGATGLAKAGFLETADAVDVLTTVINAYGLESSKATKVANMLIQTQNDGKTTVNELSQAMGQVIPTASALHVPLEQVTAAYAVMTKQGIDTKSATTALRATLNELSKEGSTSAKILKEKTGKTFGELMADGNSLGDVLQILSDSVGNNSEAFKNLFGNVRAGTGALSLLNNGVDEYNAEVKKMVNSTNNVEDALNELATPGAAVRKALNEIVNVGIQIGDVLAPYIQKAATYIQLLIDKFNNLSPRVKKLIVMVGVIAAAIGPVLVIIGKITTGIGSLIGILGKAGTVIKIVTTILSFLASTGLLPIIAIIAAVVAAGVILYKNWDKIKAAAKKLKNSLISTFNQIKSKVTSIWNGIKKAITKPITQAITLVKNGVAKLKKIINGAKLKLPKIKLPHFKISGKFSLTPPKVPKVSVSWYKKGGIFDSPSLIGIGEAGPEAVVPLDKLWEKLDNIAAASSGNETVINIYASPGMNVNELAIAVERRLATLQKQRNMAYGGI